MNQSSAGLLLTILTILATVFGLLSIQAPQVLQEDGPADRFSAQPAK